MRRILVVEYNRVLVWVLVLEAANDEFGKGGFG
jgi:hypothetical protein